MGAQLAGEVARGPRVRALQQAAPAARRADRAGIGLARAAGARREQPRRVPARPQPVAQHGDVELRTTGRMRVVVDQQDFHQGRRVVAPGRSAASAPRPSAGQISGEQATCGAVAAAAA